LENQQHLFGKESTTMSGTNSRAGDDMIRRLEAELSEKENFLRSIFDRANAASRDLDDSENEMMAECRGRMESIQKQLKDVSEVHRLAYETRSSARVVDDAIAKYNGAQPTGEVEYRSAGSWALDTYKGHLGDREANSRLETYYRAADHQKTTDNLGVIPDPIVGNLVNFIDNARPLVSLLGVQPLTNATWYRPRVTQHTSVAAQGSAGAAADEKSELASQKMIITRLTGTAKTYGGYVNVSRQNIDFSQPGILDAVINDLASQYAIQTEAATAAAISATATTAVGYGASPTAATVSSAIWTAAATAYNVTKGQGRVVLVIAPDRLGTFGPLFAPVNPQNAQSEGFFAGNFAQGQMGSISGVPVYMSAGLASTKAYLLSTSAIEVFEQRIGTLQVTEPSVLGVQVAYAGYFTPLTIDATAIIPLTAT
jgi:HK97 family phage major capsid protein